MISFRPFDISFFFYRAFDGLFFEMDWFRIDIQNTVLLLAVYTPAVYVGFLFLEQKYILVIFQGHFGK